MASIIHPLFCNPDPAHAGEGSIFGNI